MKKVVETQEWAEYVKKHDLTENVLYGEEFSSFLAGIQNEFGRILKAKGVIQ
jgi:tripartite-type tricarboxylate transporter receptor subunit TctC